MKLPDTAIFHGKEKEIEEILCKHKVKSLHAFGSALSNDFNEESDIYLLVEFIPMPMEEYADNYFDLLEALEQICQRQIDLVTLPSVRNPNFKQEVDKTKQLIFESNP